MLSGQCKTYEAAGAADKGLGQARAWEHDVEIVWAATRYLGCAIGSCSAGVTDAAGQQYNVDNYLVCEYWPPGNVFGAFPRNVPPLLSGARSVCTRRS
ncbi:related to fruiting body protein SC7 [Haematococcus lacustris]|uniref:Related to fruiting body protein SC7 n=1 Tax=Haematococcus lacustris TaxID=44745 RepID=A0A6A0A1Y0_HAELA|nr:related to fruiting body protein SC7 [Haematococcus lacustris]